MLHARMLTFLGCALVLAACNAPDARSRPTLAELQATQVKNLTMPSPGVVAAGQPTEEQLTRLAKAGVTRVVCLRPATENGTGWEEAKAKELGITFVRVPIASSDDLTLENVKKVAAEMDAGKDDTVMVCCGSSNRVGAMLAMKAFYVDGMSAEEALALGKSAGLSALEPKIVEKLKK